MMQTSLLALSTPMIIAIVVGVIAVLGITVYGALRKFSRMSWGGWQIAIILAISLLFPLLNDALQKKFDGSTAEYVMFGVTFGGLFAVTAAVLGIGALIRGFIRKREGRKNLLLGICDRLGGVLTAYFDVALTLAIAGGIGILVLQAVLPQGSEPYQSFASVFENEFVVKYAPYAIDAFLIYEVAYAMKAGYKLGVGRFLWVAITLALTFVAVVASVYLVFTVPFLNDFAGVIAGWLSSVGPVYASIFGFVLAALVVFLVFFAVIVVISVLLNKLFKMINRVRGLNIASGIVMGTIFAVFMAAFLILLATGFRLLVNYDFASLVSSIPQNEQTADALAQITAIMDQISGYFKALEAVLLSAPVTRVLYACNPVYPLIESLLIRA